MMKSLLPILLAAFWHPFFVSVIDINYNKQEQTLETSIRIFTDDFENSLKMRFPGKKIDLYNANAATDSLINTYLKEKIQIRADGKLCKWNYIGSERVEESTWCYVEIEQLPMLRQLQISNRLLYEYKKEQINMHHVNVNGQQQSFKLDNPSSEVVFKF